MLSGNELFVRPWLPLVFLCAVSKLAAQDPFEIHIYEYERMKLGEYGLKAHLNLTAQGTAVRDGTLLPTARHEEKFATRGTTSNLRQRISLADRLQSRFRAGNPRTVYGSRLEL
jgi:hypothetical protein